MWIRCFGEKSSKKTWKIEEMEGENYFFQHFFYFTLKKHKRCPYVKFYSDSSKNKDRTGQMYSNWSNSPFMKIKFRPIFEILFVHKPSLGSCEVPVPLKIWTRSVHPFWHLLDSNKLTNKKTYRQTDKQSIHIYICIEEIELILVKKYHIDEKAMYG